VRNSGRESGTGEVEEEEVNPPSLAPRRASEQRGKQKRPTFQVLCLKTLTYLTVGDS
jgi:hypothetical protein